jgi:hypothetical protein
MGDPIVAMPGMAPQVAVQAIPHVNKLFRNNDFQ